MKILKDIYYSEEKIAEKSLDVYLPDGECRAVFLYIHGGGIEAGSKGDQHREGEYLAERGYAFVSINYRMYPNARFPEFIEDSAEAVAWAKKNMLSLCGCDKLYVGGSSAGGYISMMLCFDKHYLNAVRAVKFRHCRLLARCGSADHPLQRPQIRRVRSAQSHSRRARAALFCRT